ncbi:membrane metallo-endopeptidase-like 1 [Drosophila tropicalis]|uniref:membrane metallo-endopeptidase-like 1 n=1 Tax=Drosophila tropicalis TaxID=46794 RepID=UPI0035ABB9A3
MTQKILWALTVSILWTTCVAKPTVEGIANVEGNATVAENEKVNGNATVETNANETENLVSENADADTLKSYADRMKSFMNFSISPCDDFYEYACGNWKNVKQDRQSSHKRNNLLDIFYTLSDVTEKLLTKISLAIDLDYEAELQIAQQFYNACLTADLQPLPAADPAYLALIKSIGGFPAVEGTAWQADKFSWFNMSAHLTNYGVRGLINEDIQPQYPFAPFFSLPELGFEYIVHSDNIATNETRGFKLNEERMRGYLQTFGLTEEGINEVIAGVFAFWHDALDISDRFEEDEDKCNLMTKINETVQFPQWSNYYEIAWNGQNFSKEKLSRFCDFYYEELDKVCIEHAPAVANYLAMKLLYTMDAKLKEVKFQRDYCKLTVQYSMPYLLDKLYFLEYFSEEIHSEIKGIINELRKSLRVVLENAQWLDDETRREALEKESTIESRIGSFKDDELVHRLIREMKNLTFLDGTYAQNNINLKRFKVYMNRFNGHHNLELSNETKPLELIMGMQVNAFYYNIDNSINVMAGLLHPPAFHQTWPNSLKFGTIGYLVGHEFTHGFDSVGSNYDSHGKRRYWWSKKSGAVFKERAQCYVDHYNNYLIPEINRKINGNQTKDENIADGGGLREALSAYRNFMKDQLAIAIAANETFVPKSEQMPGMDHSPEQLFFLGFAQLWCAAYKEEHYWEELTNEHTMDKYRVLGAVSNNEDFATAYNCSLGSPMNLQAAKCRVW